MKKLIRSGWCWRDEDDKAYVWNDEEKFVDDNGNTYKIIKRVNDDEVIVEK